MEPLKLEDLIPEPGEFTLNSTGQTYRFRMCSLADEIWLTKNFTRQEFLEIMESGDWENIAKIMFHQLDTESKLKLQKQKVEFVDDNGERSEVEIGGSKLLLAIICGQGEQKAAIEAYAKTRGISSSVLEQVADYEDKKKATQLTGQKSSTSSQASTDGQMSTS